MLARDVCSYGYFLLRPNFWDTRRRILVRPLELSTGPATLSIAQPGGAVGERGRPLRVTTDRTLSKPEGREARTLISRMLRLDEDAAHIRAFHKADRRWKKAGAGRLFRSPTMFEDAIKTVTSCNVAWTSTIAMNRRLCEVAGRRSGGDAPHTFPTPARLARTRPATLRARCGVGYRDRRIVELARLFDSGHIDPAWYEDPATPDDAIHAALLELPGIGPYAAANIMQLLGRYARLPLDTESVRHGRTVLGMEGTERDLMKRLHAHYAPFGAHAFRSYWFELWQFYESRVGPAPSWEQATTGRQFTAAVLKRASTKDGPPGLD